MYILLTTLFILGICFYAWKLFTKLAENMNENEAYFQKHKKTGTARFIRFDIIDVGTKEDDKFIQKPMVQILDVWSNDVVFPLDTNRNDFDFNEEFEVEYAKFEEGDYVVRTPDYEYPKESMDKMFKLAKIIIIIIALIMLSVLFYFANVSGPVKMSIYFLATIVLFVMF